MFDGGNDRGKNQEKVISAIKQVSFSQVSNFTQYINLQDSVQTNMF